MSAGQDERIGQLPIEDRGLVARLQEALAAIAEVQFAYLFGSRTRGQGRIDSDVDLAIMLGPPAVQLDQHERIRWLAPVLQHAAGDRLDLVFLDRAGVVLSQRVLREGIIVNDADPQARVRHYVKTVGEYLDTARIRITHVRATIDRAREGKTIGRPGDPLQALARLGRAGS